jgi:transcriptional regulator with GAF, ATPase, and Fis domain
MDADAPPSDAVTELLLDVAATPLADLLSGDLLPAVCADLGGALRVGGVTVLLLVDSRVVPAGWHGPAAEQVARLQAEHQQGPGVRAAREGRTVVLEDDAEWPLAAAEHRAGVTATVAAPLRYGDASLGCLQLLLTDRRPVTPDLVARAERAAGVLGVVTGNADLYRGSLRTAAHLSEVLVQRAPLEQAKGLLAERHRIGVGEAFGLLRTAARRRRTSVTHVAREVVAEVRPGAAAVGGAAVSAAGAVAATPAEHPRPRDQPDLAS